MVDVIHGKEEYKIKEHIKKITKKYPDADVIKVDLALNPIEMLLNEAMIPSMFGNKKVLIGENSYFLTGVKKTGVINQNVDALLAYLEQKHDAHLILIVTEEALDGRKKIVKELKKQFSVTEYNPKDQNPVNFVMERLKEAKLISDPPLAKQIVNQVGHDLLILNNEIDKLILYMDEDKELTADIIKQVLVKNILDNIWDLTDAVLDNDKRKVISLYNSMLSLGEDPVKIYSILASQYRLMLEVRTLSDAGFTNKDIASNLGVHPYRIELALNKSRRYDKDTLNKYLEALYDLDLKVKSGKTDPVLGLNNFLLLI